MKVKKAFSLIELSVVLLIIGIVIAGVMQSSRVIAQMRINTARALTKSSPVASIRNLILWIDAASTESFAESEKEDGFAISTWYDLNSQSSLKNDFTASSTTRPLYYNNIINSLPAIKFDGTDDFMSSANFPNIFTPISVFMVLRPASTGAYSIISKKDSVGSSTVFEALLINNSSGTVSGWGFEISGSSSSSTQGQYSGSAHGTISENQNYIASIVFDNQLDSGNDISFYQNGTHIATVGYALTSELAISNAVNLGKRNASGITSKRFYNGYIGELIIFNKKVTTEERQDIEKYLGKKWGIAVSQ